MRDRRRKGTGIAAGVLAAAAAAAVACSTVLGIGDRSIDPTLDAAADGSGSSSGGSSGMASGSSSGSSGSSSGSSSGMTSGSSGGSGGATSSSSGTGGDSGAGDAGAGDASACGDPCVLASGLNHPFMMTSDDTRVYWTEFGDDQGTANGSVKSCPVAGCGSGPLVYAIALLNPRGVVVDAQNVYWGTATYGNVNGGIWSCPIAGCANGPKQLATAGIPYGLAVDGAYVYWVDGDAYTVLRVAKAGGGSSSLLYDAGSGAINAPRFCAVDSAYVYLTDTQTGVYRMPLTGGNPAQIAPPNGTYGYWPLVLDTNSVYYGGAGQILRADKTWTDGGVPIVSTVPDPDGLALDTATGALYWSDWGSGFANDGTIGKVPVAGGGSTVLAASLATPEAVAVSGNYVFWLSNGTLDVDSGSALSSTGTLLRRAK